MVLKIANFSYPLSFSAIVVPHVQNALSFRNERAEQLFSALASGVWTNSYFTQYYRILKLLVGEDFV